MKYVSNEKLTKMDLENIENSHEVSHRLWSEKEKWEMRLDLPLVFTVIGMFAITLLYAKMDLYSTYGSAITTIVLFLSYLIIAIIGYYKHSDYYEKIWYVGQLLKEERRNRDHDWENYYYWEVYDKLGEIHE